MPTEGSIEPVDADAATRASGEPAGENRPSRIPPVLVGLTVLLAAAFVGLQYRASEARALEEVTEVTLRRVTSDVQRRLEDEIRALERLARRWEARAGMARREWEADARLLLDHLPHLQAIEWVDTSFRVRWVVPLDGNEAALDLDLGFEVQRRRALELAREQRSVTITRIIDLVQGGRGFLVYLPLEVAGEFRGFVLGVYRVRPTLAQILDGAPPGFSIRVREGDELLWSHVEGSETPRWGRRAGLALHDLAWDVQIAPGPGVVATHRTWFPALVVAGGTVNAFFLSLVYQFARSGRWRARRVLETNRRLRDEMARRARAEEAVQEARDELVAVVSSFPDHVWSGQIEEGGALVPRFYSDAIGRIAGRPASLFREDPPRWLEVVHPEDRAAVAEAYRSLREGANGFSIEYRVERPDGEIRWVRDRVRATRKDGQLRLDGVISDVTGMKRAEEERVQLEASFQEAQKLESLGVLAGGIAHDFNNLLVGVLGHAHVALQELPGDSHVRTSIERVERSARRAAELCRQLLAYAGKGTAVIEPLDLREVVEEMGDLLAASRSKKISVRYDFEASLPAIEADANQIRQLVLNLITNASEAIGDRRGVIEISARVVEVERGRADESALGAELEPGRYVELCVRDDGCGMDEETRRRLFEPFYSTKFAGRGLGLAAVLGIVRAHRGGIRVTSQPGRGAHIAIGFPALDEAVRPRTTRSSQEVPRGSGTLLLVDDEPDAREVGQLMLERAGFRVLTAEDGASALETFARHRDEIECILLDLTMPDMDGEETHRRLQRVAPGVRVILCSGYPEQEAVKRFQGRGLAGFLGKPYTPEALLAVVRQVLDAPPA